MIAALYVLYVLDCLFLILVVLLQAGKGDGMGAAFGGTSSTVLGNRGAATFLSRLTVGSAVLFMLLSVVLAFHSSAPGSRLTQRRTSNIPFGAPAGMGDDGDEPSNDDGDEPPGLDIELTPGVDVELPTGDDDTELPTGDDDTQSPTGDDTESPPPVPSETESAPTEGGAEDDSGEATPPTE